jgi:aspartate kinase
MSMITMKFGGTSVGNAAAMRQTAQIICRHTDEGHQVVTVASAMATVTNALIKAARDSEQGDVASYKRIAEQLRQLHIQTTNDLVSVANRRQRLQDEIYSLLEDFEQLCHSISIMREVTPRGMDVVSSMGERLSVRILAAHLEDIGREAQAIDSSTLITTNDQFQDAKPEMDISRQHVQEKVLPLLERGVLPIITGFMGATPNGTITTLGRGGSDYSAGIIAACLPADELWIWSDVDGVMSADPRMSDKAKTIAILGYGEVNELAYFGAKVLHPRTILPVMDFNMPIRVLNTFNAEHPGTLIKPQPQIVPGAIKAVTTIADVHMLTVYGRGMVGVPGIAGRAFTAVAQAGASMLMFAQSSSEQSFCFVIPSKTSPKVKQSIDKELERERARRDVEEVLVEEDVVIVTAVGAGMRSTPGVAARIFGALEDAGVNVLSTAQGSSEYSISVVVHSDHALTAVNALQAILQNGD